VPIVGTGSSTGALWTPEIMLTPRRSTLEADVAKHRTTTTCRHLALAFAIWYTEPMTKLVQEAIDKLSALPEATQESIAEDLIAHVESVEHLRAELQKGIDSLDHEEGREFDIEQLIEAARAKYEQQ